MRLSLIPDWTSAWRFTSVITAAILAALSVVQAALPTLNDQQFMSPQAFAYTSLALAVLAAVCRVIQQAPSPVEPEVKEALVARANAVPVIEGEQR